MNTISCISDFDKNIYIYYIDMPHSIASNIVENADGSYTLYLNSRLTYERQIEGYLHELRHINNNDLEAYSNVSMIELRAHS